MTLKKELSIKVGSLLPENEWISHRHLCDFQMLGYSSRKQKQLCKRYLKSIGKKRDCNMSCCDECKHMKFVICDSDDYEDLIGIISPIMEGEENGND